MLRWLSERSSRRQEQGRGADQQASADADRFRVLVEYPSSGTPTVLADVLERAGYEPVICEGPGDTGGVCPLVRSGECLLVAEADVIFNGFGLGTAAHREIVQKLREIYPETPLVVEATQPRAEENVELLDGCALCRTPLTASALVEAVDQACAGQDP